MSRIAVCFLLLVATARVAAAEPDISTFKKERRHRRSVRNAGHLLIGGAVAMGGAVGVAVALGKRSNDAIRLGGYATDQDIADQAAAGKRYNLAAWGFAGAGAAMAVTGFALVLTHPDPERPRIEATPVNGGAMLGVSGVLP